MKLCSLYCLDGRCCHLKLVRYLSWQRSVFYSVFLLVKTNASEDQAIVGTWHMWPYVRSAAQWDAVWEAFLPADWLNIVKDHDDENSLCEIAQHQVSNRNKKPIEYPDRNRYCNLSDLLILSSFRVSGDICLTPSSGSRVAKRSLGKMPVKNVPWPSRVESAYQRFVSTSNPDRMAMYSASVEEWQ
ncbi:hypothetical protein Tco_0129369 [Tanacetum coccineum]